MKRHPRLVQLSREHHLALRLGRNLQREDKLAAGLAELATEQAELLSHFAEEERDLLPLLRTHGHQAEADWVLADHARLRALFVACLAGDVTAAAPTGEALVAHVRHEERVLFPLLESLFEDA